jgi:hypothetical protein
MERDLMRDYAVAGMDAAIERAKAELDQLLRQRAALGGMMTRRKQVKAAASSAADGDAAPARKRRKRTAAERKAVSIRMKKYWAERRKGEKK